MKESAVQDRAITVDDILGPYEQRPVEFDRETIARRKRALSLGEQLNRLQGAQPNPVRTRLVHLYALGQVTHPEYIQLAGEIARRGLFPRDEETMDGR